ncbi:MAG: FG-GAP-like repeat-containing protein [Bacteroidota bacterium]
MRFLLLNLLLLFLPFSLRAQSYFEEISTQSRIANTGSGNQGVAIADFDKDGDDDIYVFTRQNENKLFQNQGNGNFLNVAPSYGLHYSNSTRTAAWGDLNNDGWPDLYLANYQHRDLLFIHKGMDEQGRISFEEISLKAGIDNKNEPRSVVMADFNRDGLLDIYVCNYLSDNKYYQNRGNLTFEELSQEKGLTGHSFSMSAMAFDYDNDADTDLYLVHDFLATNLLFENNGQGEFIEKGEELGLAIEGYGMGVDAADINRDGYLDLYITDLNQNYLMFNDQGKEFYNIAEFSAVNDPGMGWSCFFEDFDNDGWKDLYVVNDSYFHRSPNACYRNAQNSRFLKMAEEEAVSSWKGGLGGTSLDIDADGNMDILISNNTPGEGNQLFRNLGKEAGNWLSIQLEGTQSNRDAIGASIQVRYGQGEQQFDQLMAGSGYASQTGKKLHVGLGKSNLVDELKIQWPNGQIDLYHNLKVNRSYHFKQLPFSNKGKSDLVVKTISPNPFFSKINLEFTSTQAGKLRLDLTDFSGKKVFACAHEVSKGGFHQIQQDLSYLPRGTYFLLLKWDGKNVFQQPLIKQKP